MEIPIFFSFVSFSKAILSNIHETDKINVQYARRAAIMVLAAAAAVLVQYIA